MSKILDNVAWGTRGRDVDTLDNIISTTEAKADYNGNENTTILVAFQTTEGKTVANSAAINCHEYSTKGTNAGDWYLPAAGELSSYVSGGGINYNKINTTMTTLDWTFGSINLWSSSEYNNDCAWFVRSNDGHVNLYGFKDNQFSVSCFLAIN